MAVTLRAPEVREQLDRILSDAAFSGANRRSRLLRYLVEQTLEDNTESLKESVIATEVFDRAPGYDPQIDSVVRVEVGRLRTRLAEYYDKAGGEQPVRIEIPKGGYRPLFVFREQAAETIAARPSKWKWVAAGAAIAVLGAVALAVWRTRAAAPAALATVAVLPFLNLSGEATDEYLGDGISEELTQALAEFNDLRVVSRTSAFQYKGKGADAREIGRNLRVGAVLEGSVLRRGGQLHVIAQLIRTSDGFHLWSHTYEPTLAELAPVETGIARATRETLVPTPAPASLPGAGTPREVATTRSPEAHDLYMRAVYEFNQRTETSTRQALDLARQATEKDPSFAQPFVLMAACESQLTQLQVQAPRAGAERAWGDIEKALSLDPGNSGAHAQKALLAYTDHWDWPQAETEFLLSLAGGSHGSAENLYGWCLITRGRFEEARRRLQIAAELDPLSLGPQLNQVEELMAEQNYPEAKKKVEQILRTAPTNPVALSEATSIGFWQKDCPAAAASSRKLLDLYPQSPGAHLGSIAADFVCGNTEARTAARELFRHPSGYLSPYSIAGAIALERDADGAMQYLEQSAELHEPRLMMLKYERVFEPIRKDPRFIALERRLGLLE